MHLFEKKINYLTSLKSYTTYNVFTKNCYKDRLKGWCVTFLQKLKRQKKNSPLPASIYTGGLWDWKRM